MTLRLPAAVTAGITVLGVAACGSSQPSSSSASSAGGGSPSLSAAQIQSRVTLAKCLRAHGIDVPDSAATSVGAGRSAVQRLVAEYPPAEIRAALSACRSDLVSALPQLALTPAEVAQRNRAALAYVRCLRAHGIGNVPDPVPHGVAVGLVKALSNVDTSSPAFVKANDACASLRPPPLLG